MRLRVPHHLACGISLVILVVASARAAEASKPGEGVRWVYLIRHGMYDRDSKSDDRVANGLNPLGHEQARIVGEHLAQLARITTLVCSNYTRARETAEDMGRVLGMTPVSDSLLHECTPPTSRTDLTKDHSAAEIGLCESNLQAAWSKYMRPSPDADAHDVLVCHGNVIRWFVCKALGADTKCWASMDIANASITVIGVRADGSTKLAAFSDTGYLPAERQTWTGRGAGWSPPPKE